MSKFNTKKESPVKTTNQSGWPAFKMSEKEHLVTLALTSLFGETKYYGSTDDVLIKLATKCAHSDPEFLSKLTVYARKEANLRTVSHALTAVIAHDAREYTRETVKNVIVRADDVLEIMSAYLSLYGKPFPNALKREIANVLATFSSYDFAKYKGNKRQISFKDVFGIVHPRPETPEQAELYAQVYNGTLETPYTWETRLSSGEDKKKVWEELIDSGKVGYMALLRNLNNMLKAEISHEHLEKVLGVISDPERVRTSKQLPFRFFSAYAQIKKDLSYDLDTETRQIVENALEKAIESSIANMETIPGRTLIAIDESGSMIQSISQRSVVTCGQIGSLLGVLASKICEDATVCRFSGQGWKRSYSDAIKIVKYGKYDGILAACNQKPLGGSTDLSLPMHYALNDDIGTRPFDRVIYFSDNECNSSYGLRKTVQSQVEKYRRKFNPNFWVHGVDLCGYGTQQFIGSRFNLIAGWGETVLPFILLAERGIGTLVDAISNYKVDA